MHAASLARFVQASQLIAKRWLARHALELKGFSAQNLWRMKQFYEIYHQNEKLSALLRVLSWTHHCILMAQCKNDQERFFYAEACVQAGWSKRELENQIKRGNYERTALASQKLSPAVRVLSPEAKGVFKDTYLLDFLDLPEVYSEHDLQAGLIKNLCKF